MTDSPLFTSRQLVFKELFVGTLVYSVVLGFFNDYTNLVYAQSFSTIFLAAIVLEILTFLVLKIKSRLLTRFKLLQKTSHKSAVLFCLWLVMFLSKFVFIWVIDLLFGDYLNLSGFVAVLLLVVSVTILHKLADYTFIRLSDN